MLKTIINYLREIIKNNHILRNTINTTFSMLLRSGLQLGYFVIVARTLGPEEYGSFGATLAFIAIFAPYAMLGSGNLLIKHTSRNKEKFCTYWGSSLSVVLIMGALLTIFILFAYRYFLPTSINLGVVLLICLSDLFFTRFIDISSQALQSYEMISKMNQVQIITSSIKFASALLLLIPVFSHTIDTWAIYYFISSLLGSIYAVNLVNRLLGKGVLDPRPILKEVSEGFYFSIGLSSSSIYNDIDKTMLSKYSTLEATGIYVAAYRLIDAAMTPLRALLTSLYTSFFAAGEKGVNGTIPIVRKMIPYSFGYGIIACGGMLLISGFMPSILGPEYQQTVLVLRLLSPIIVFRSIHNILGDSIAGAGLQGIRSANQIVVAIINICLNLYLIPLYGLFGAIGSSIVCDFLLLVLSCTIIISSGMKKSNSY
jgi:O-antigen/teichoic acid export membrane protein